MNLFSELAFGYNSVFPYMICIASLGMNNSWFSLYNIWQQGFLLFGPCWFTPGFFLRICSWTWFWVGWRVLCRWSDRKHILRNCLFRLVFMCCCVWGFGFCFLGDQLFNYTYEHNVFWVSSVALLRTTTKKSEPNVRKSQEGITYITYIYIYIYI